MSDVTLLLGGARAGKSRIAARIAAGWTSSVTVIATAEARDEEMAVRIARHRAERPADWATVEEPLEVEAVLRKLPPDNGVILDCLTLWVSNAMEAGLTDEELLGRAGAAAEMAAGRAGPAVIVTNEVGSGIVPMNEYARRYRDLLGGVNTVWSERADRALLVVAGRALRLEALPEDPA